MDMKPRSRQKRLEVWLGPAFKGSVQDFADTYTIPHGYQLVEVIPGRKSPNGSQKVTLVCQLLDDGPRRVVCKRCGTVLVDMEPYDVKPDYHHPTGSTCEHAGKCYPPPESYKTYYPKKARRARKRGAKLARKMTRRASH